VAVSEWPNVSLGVGGLRRSPRGARGLTAGVEVVGDSEDPNSEPIPICGAVFSLSSCGLSAALSARFNCPFSSAFNLLAKANVSNTSLQSSPSWTAIRSHFRAFPKDTFIWQRTFRFLRSSHLLVRLKWNGFGTVRVVTGSSPLDVSTVSFFGLDGCCCTDNNFGANSVTPAVPNPNKG
jgi:hypothetical protein